MNFVMGVLSFIFSPIFGFIGELVKKIPGWLWLALGLTVLVVGVWLYANEANKRQVESYEKQIKEANEKSDEVKRERDTALSDAEAYKAQRDSERASAEMAREERDNLATSDAELQRQLRAARSRANALAAQERDELGDPEKFAERLSTIQGRVDCRLDLINANATGDC